MQQHTPGPWHIGEHGYILADDGEPVGLVRVQNMPREANARLIAAAPDLLKACKAALEILHNPYTPIGMRDAEAYDVLRGAINAAEGKP